MLRIMMAGVAALTALLPTQVHAQAEGEATMFSRGNFKGPRLRVLGPTRLAQPFVMKSVVIPAGTQWEFCSGSTFSGCRQISQSVPAMVMTVRSARPVAVVLTSGPTGPGQVLPGTAGQASPSALGPSLRGIASEYFIAPGESGYRVEVNPGTAEAMSRRAIEFCRKRGWRIAAYERLQAVGGKFYLADVLCAEAGR